MNGRLERLNKCSSSGRLRKVLGVEEAISCSVSQSGLGEMGIDTCLAIPLGAFHHHFFLGLLGRALCQ